MKAKHKKKIKMKLTIQSHFRSSWVAIITIQIHWNWQVSIPSLNVMMNLLCYYVWPDQKFYQLYIAAVPTSCQLTFTPNVTRTNNEQQQHVPNCQSCERYSAVPSCGAVWYNVVNIWVGVWIPKVWQFNWKLLRKCF